MLDWIKNFLEVDRGNSEPTLNPQVRVLLLESLRDCSRVYRAASYVVAHECPEQMNGNLDSFLEYMEDLHRGLIIKLLVDIAQSDRYWNVAECEAAEMILKYVWKVKVDQRNLEETLRSVAERASKLKWKSLLKPFIEMPPLREKLSEVIGIALRIANLIAKADGEVQPPEASTIRRLQAEFQQLAEQRNSRQKKPARQTPTPTGPDPTSGNQKIGTQDADLEVAEAAPKEELTPEERKQRLDEAMKALDELVGLAPVKEDIRELINFLKIQSARESRNLATPQVSLHTVFEGNPGTGKTTVARILADILCGFNIIDGGQTIETDRSGLVAQYAGQTGPKTNECIDEAIDGILFIDEAYSLIAEAGDDAYGLEAIQTLLKRMEDDRGRLVVILAGYPEPMERMLKSNPGLSSRFQRTFHFPDYTAKEMLKIFYLMCKKNHYRIPERTQRKLYADFKKAIEEKDEHFGNGRLVRNVFEDSIRRMASRIVDVAPLTSDILTTIEPEDIHVKTSS